MDGTLTLNTINLNQSSGVEIARHTKMQYRYAVRRLKRASVNIQNDKFVQSLANKSGGNIFAEIKKFRGSIKKCSSNVDGETGSANIANHFANTYSALYSRVELGEKFDNLKASINSDINEESLNDINKLNSETVKLALYKMKNGKSDVLFDFMSDLLTHGPPILTEHIVNMFRGFVTHGIVTFFLLICTLVPIIKDKMGNHAASDNVN